MRTPNLDVIERQIESGDRRLADQEERVALLDLCRHDTAVALDVLDFLRESQTRRLTLRARLSGSR